MRRSGHHACRDVASVHGLRLWHARALHELGTIDELRTESTASLEQVRELAVDEGSLALTVMLDMEIAAGLKKQSGAVRRWRPPGGRRRLTRFRLAICRWRELPGDSDAIAVISRTWRRRSPRLSRSLRATGCARLRGGPLPGYVRAAGRAAQRGPRADDGRGRAAAEFPGDDRAPFLGLWPLLGACWSRTRPEPRPGCGPRAARGTW